VRAGVEKITPVGGMQEELDLLRERLADLEQSLVELESEPAVRRPKRRKARK
jgi:hypothetical protein